MESGYTWMECAARRQVAIVTGASSGFGLLTARALAQQGHTAFATMRGVDSKNAVVAASLRELAEAEKEDLDLRVVELDVTDDRSVEQAVERAAETAGRIDILVNNAGAALQRFQAALGAAQTSSQTSDPRDVAEAIVALVELPAGQRPLRTVVAASELERAGTHAINEAVANVQDGFIAGFGLRDLVTLQQPAA